MQLLNLLVVAGAAFASPLGKRLTGTTANEFKNGGCRDIIFFFARGTTEPGNMGNVGSLLSDALKLYYGESRVATQGVDYSATILPNTFPGGCDPKDAAVLTGLVNEAASRCPNSKVVVSGYSQGAALTHRGVEKLSPDVIAKIGAAVTFGDTQKKQDGGRIPNVPLDKTHIICNDGDEVCNGTLIITPAHLDYQRRVPEAASFVESKIAK